MKFGYGLLRVFGELAWNWRRRDVRHSEDLRRQERHWYGRVEDMVATTVMGWSGDGEGEFKFDASRGFSASAKTRPLKVWSVS